MSDRLSTHRGAAYLVLSTFLFVIVAALVKILAEQYSIIEIAFARTFFGLIPALLLSHRKGRIGFITKRPLSHFWRGLFGIASMLLIFKAYAMIPLPDATAISFAGPLFITALSTRMLHEHVGKHRWTAVVAGFLGVLLVMKPGGSLFHIGGLTALGAALCYALAMISLRKLRDTENTEVTTLYFTLFGALITGCLLPFAWKMANLQDGILLILVGVISGIGQHFLTKAYGMADASAISPFSYISILWASILGLLIWGEVPAWTTIFGSLMVIGSGIYILHRERVRSVHQHEPLAVPEP